MAFFVTGTLKCTFVSVTLPIVGMMEYPGFYSLYNIIGLFVNGMSSLLELEDHFFMDIHVSISTIAAVFNSPPEDIRRGAWVA